MNEQDHHKVSCLLPVYNGEQFIEEAVRSILAQTLKNFELVVVDDGSTDSTPRKLAALNAEDRRIRILRQPNGGIVAALNAGLGLCCAGYIARMDADDVAAPDRFEFQADYLDRHPGCVLVGGVARSNLPLHSVARTTGGRHRKTDLSIFPPRVAVAVHPLIMVRRSALLTIGGYRADYIHAEDYDLFLRLAPFGTIANPVKEVLYYRRHEGAVSIKNVVVQERSAVEAEQDAIKAAGYRPIEDWLIEPYVRLRVFRRLQTIDLNKAASCVPAVIRDSVCLSLASLISARYWRLRTIIVYTVLKYFRRRGAASSECGYESPNF